MNEQFWWYLARSSGVVAWVLATLAVLWGMALATKVLGSKPRPAWLLDLHRHLGGLSVAFVALHMLALVADSYAHFGWSELFVPMASTWSPGPVTWGIVAFYLLVVVEVTSLLMKRLPRKVWHTIHLLSYIVFVTSTVHAATAGTDATNRVAFWTALLLVAAFSFVLAYRQLAPKRAARAASRTAAARAAQARTQTHTATAESPSGKSTAAESTAGPSAAGQATPGPTAAGQATEADEILEGV